MLVGYHVAFHTFQGHTWHYYPLLCPENWISLLLCFHARGFSSNLYWCHWTLSFQVEWIVAFTNFSSFFQVIFEIYWLFFFSLDCFPQFFSALAICDPLLGKIRNHVTWVTGSVIPFLATNLGSWRDLSRRWMTEGTTVLLLSTTAKRNVKIFSVLSTSHKSGRHFVVVI